MPQAGAFIDSSRPHDLEICAVNHFDYDAGDILIFV